MLHELSDAKVTSHFVESVHSSPGPDDILASSWRWRLPLALGIMLLLAFVTSPAVSIQPSTGATIGTDGQTGHRVAAPLAFHANNLSQPSQPNNSHAAFKIAQFGHLKLPFPIPGGGSASGILKGAAIDQAIRAVGKQFQSDSPILSSAREIFPTLTELPGAAFNPGGDVLQVVRQLHASRDGSVMLPPGDYLIPVDVFCMKATAHSPNGHRYLLARLKGKMADVITALNTRSIGAGIPHIALQVLSWNIQAGMKYEEMSPDNRSLVDQLLPDFKKRMSRSFYEELEGSWNGAANRTGLPSLDSSLDKMGEVGHAINALRETRSALMQYANNNREIARRLVPPSDQEQGWDTTPWSQVSDRVAARLITEGNYSTPAKLEIRVLPRGGDMHSSALQNRGRRVLAATGLGPAANVDVTNMVGDPQDSGVQPLTMSPQTGGPDDSRDRPTEGAGRKPDKWKTEYPRKTFQNCEDAAHFINNNPDNVGLADVQLRADISQFTVTKQPDGSYKAQETVTWSVDPATTKITLPAWSWPNMTPAQTAALNTYSDALRGHEEGHVAVAEKEAAALSGPRFGTGATPQQATDDLKTILAAFKDTAAKAVQQQEDSYDEAVQHGGAQKDGPKYGFPGGDDVALNCP